MPARRLPLPGAKSGGGARELLIALNGRRAKRDARVIAVELYGAKLATEWETDGWLRSRTRRQLRKAKRFVEERRGWDYRAMAARAG